MSVWVVGLLDVEVEVACGKNKGIRRPASLQRTGPSKMVSKYTNPHPRECTTSKVESAQ